MKALLPKKFTDSFNMKKLTREIEDLFDNYNFMCELVKEQIILETSDFVSVRKQRDTRGPELKELLEKEECQRYVDLFSRKIESLKETFNEDEATIFKYSILEREYDKEVCERICKTSKTYYMIKKSCYVKVALCFHLAEKEICATLERNFLVNVDI